MFEASRKTDISTKCNL